MTPTTKAKQRLFLDELIDDLRAKRISHLALVRRLKKLRAQLHNRSSRRGRRSSPETYLVRSAIVRCHRRHGDWSMQEIAQHLNCSIGRVSEVLRGKRR